MWGITLRILWVGWGVNVAEEAQKSVSGMGENAIQTKYIELVSQFTFNLPARFLVHTISLPHLSTGFLTDIISYLSVCRI